MYMETVVIDGVTYTKASTLAKEFRYTTDYIGQLCRAGKVDAQLVGRSWYASRDSLEDHASKRMEAIRQDEMSLKNSPFLKEEMVSVKVSAPLSKQTKKMISTSYTQDGTVVSYSNTRYEPDPVDLLPVMQIRPSVPKVVDYEAFPPRIEPIINNISHETKKADNSSFSIPINQHKPVQVLASKEVSPITVHTHAKAIVKQAQNKPVQNISDITTPSTSTAKSVSFTPASVLGPTSSQHFPYKSLALVIFLLGIGVVLTTLALDMEIHYDGAISSTSFSFNQTALVNFFK